MKKWARLAGVLLLQLAANVRAVEMSIVGFHHGTLHATKYTGING